MTPATLLRAMRPGASALAGAAALASSLGGARDPDMLTLGLVFAVPTLTSSYGFLVNDICDRHADMQVHPERVLPSGQMSLSAVMLFCLVIGSISALFSLALPLWAIMINGFVLASLWAYSWVKARAAWLGNALAAAYVSLLLTFGMSIGGVSILGPYVSVGVFIITLGREMMLDVRDAFGDSNFGRTPIALKYGRNFAVIIGGASVIAGSGLLLIVAVASDSGNLSKAFLFTSAMVFVISIVPAIRLRSRAAIEKFRTRSLLAYALGVLVFAVARIS